MKKSTLEKTKKTIRKKKAVIKSRETVIQITDLVKVSTFAELYALRFGSCTPHGVRFMIKNNKLRAIEIDGQLFLDKTQIDRLPKS